MVQTNPVRDAYGEKTWRTTVPISHQQLCPKWDYTSEFEKRDLEFKRKQKENLDKRHWIWDLIATTWTLEILWSYEVVHRPHHAGLGLSCLQLPHHARSYVVDIATESLRRNRQHLLTIKDEAPVNTAWPNSRVSNWQLSSSMQCHYDPLTHRNYTMHLSTW